MLQKLNLVRLKGKAVSILNDEIHERDNYRCVCCGANVLQGEKFHHTKKYGLKNDVIEEGVTICIPCHKLAFTYEIKNKCIRYLKGLYPKYWEDVEIDG
jgi:hypothetical protein